MTRMPELIMLGFLMVSPIYMLLVHSIFARQSRALSPQMTCIISLLASYPPLLLILAWIFMTGKFGQPGEFVRAWAYFMLVYTCIGYSYFHVFNLSETARRVRLLHEILKAGSISSEKLFSLYQTADIVNVRLKRLENMGQLHVLDGKYQIKGRALLFAAQMIMVWRTLLGFESAKL